MSYEEVMTFNYIKADFSVFIIPIAIAMIGVIIFIYNFIVFIRIS